MHPVDIDSAVMGGGVVLLVIGVLGANLFVTVCGLFMLGLGVALAWGDP